MKMTKLQGLYGLMKQENHMYAIFEITYNKINLKLLFDISTNPFSLLIVRKRTDLYIKLDVKPYFEINTSLSTENYQKLVKILELKPDKSNPFKTSNFFEELNMKIPDKIDKKYKSEGVINILQKNKGIEDNEGIYILGFIDWDKTNTNNNVRKYNREKTKKLYPEIYERIKDKNISVRYTDHCDLHKKDLEF